MDVLDPFLMKLARAARQYRERWSGNAPYDEILAARDQLFKVSLVVDQAEAFRNAATRSTGDGGRMTEASIATLAPAAEGVQ